MKAYKYIGPVRGEAQFSVWLMQIAVNEARMHRRKEGYVKAETDASGFRRLV